MNILNKLFWECPFVGRLIAPIDVPILISETCEYVALYSKGRVKVAEGIKVNNLLTLKERLSWIIHVCGEVNVTIGVLKNGRQKQ
jgi:hypothetical protein